LENSIANKKVMMHVWLVLRVAWDTFANPVVQYLNLPGGSLEHCDEDTQERFRDFKFMVGATSSSSSSSSSSGYSLFSRFFLQVDTLGKSLSDQQPLRFVNLEDFGRVMAWYGPMDAKGEFLVNIRQVVMQDWFHGPMTSKVVVGGGGVEAVVGFEGGCPVLRALLLGWSSRV
jgi:hypothetical protein